VEPLIRTILTGRKSESISIIIDTDVGYDDIGALLYLLKHPEIKIRGISISCGITYIDAGVNNILRLLSYLEKQKIPVVSGKKTPLVVGHTFPKKWREKSAQFYGIKLPPTTLQSSNLSLSQLISFVWKSTKEKITLVALGPLTNLAQVIQDQIKMNDLIERFFIMGGAINIPGNVGSEYSKIPNFVAEWNFFIDPHAANIIFKSEIPKILIPLNATNKVPHTHEFRNKVAKLKMTKSLEIVYQLLNPNESYFWDELAAVALTNPEIITLENHHIKVITDKITQAGWTKSIENKKPNALVAMDVDPLKFEHQFIKILSQDRKEF